MLIVNFTHYRASSKIPEPRLPSIPRIFDRYSVSWNAVSSAMTSIRIFQPSYCANSRFVRLPVKFHHYGTKLRLPSEQRHQPASPRLTEESNESCYYGPQSIESFHGS